MSVTSTANAAAVLTLPASQLRHIIWSYSGTPTGGGIDINVAATGTGPKIDITAGGPGFLPLGNLGSSAFQITLKAGGSGVVGKLTAVYDT
jgi:hypothetical protein